MVDDASELDILGKGAVGGLGELPAFAWDLGYEIDELGDSSSNRERGEPFKGHLHLFKKDG